MKPEKHDILIVVDDQSSQQLDAIILKEWNDRLQKDILASIISLFKFLYKDIWTLGVFKKFGMRMLSWVQHQIDRVLVKLETGQLEIAGTQS